MTACQSLNVKVNHKIPNLFAVPSSPVNVSATALSSATVIIIWSEPTSPNGILLYYTLYYYSKQDRDQKLQIQITIQKGTHHAMSYNLTGLLEYTEYSIIMTASTRVGESSGSSVSVRTTCKGSVASENGEELECRINEEKPTASSSLKHSVLIVILAVIGALSLIGILIGSVISYPVIKRVKRRTRIRDQQHPHDIPPEVRTYVIRDYKLKPSEFCSLLQACDILVIVITRSRLPPCSCNGTMM